MDIWTLTRTLKTEAAAFRYLLEKGILQKERRCFRCKGKMTINLERKLYRCFKKTCKHQVSLFKHKFFHNCKFGLHKCLVLSFLFLKKVPVQSLCDLTKLSSRTVCDWSSFVRQLVGESVPIQDLLF